MSETTRILFWSYVRKSIQRHFESLLDEEFKKTWVDPNYQHAFCDSLEYYVFEFLFDTIDIDKPEEQIGVTLYNKAEAETIAKYLNFYNDTFEGSMPDSYYLNHPRWYEVIDGAKEIVEMMKDNNQKYNLEQDLDNWDKFQEANPYNFPSRYSDYTEADKLAYQERTTILDRDLLACKKKASKL